MYKGGTSMKNFKGYNCYLCPTELYPYIDVITTCKWYWANYFPDCWKEGFTEFNAKIPTDIYLLILEKAKELYLIETGDETYAHLDEKQAIIDEYTHYLMNQPSEAFPVYTYSCPSRIMEFVKKNLIDSWHSCTTLENDDPAIAEFTSNLSEEYFPLLMERAKMEWLNQKVEFGNFFLVSEAENKRVFWLAATKEFLGTDHVIYLSEKEIERYSKELDEELQEK